MPAAGPPKRSVWASPWMTGIGCVIVAAGLVGAFGNAGVAWSTVALGLFFVALSVHERTPPAQASRRRVIGIVMTGLAVAMLALAFL